MKKENVINPNFKANDFGFSVSSETPTQTRNDKVIKDILALEDLIMPLLENLRDSADKGDVINWPNRKETIQKQIDKILKITKEYKT